MTSRVESDKEEEQVENRLIEKENEDDGSALLPTPPDGGWGWIVVFASFMIHVIADGVAYSFGVFLNSFIDHFETGRGETGWLGSLMIGVTWLSGPIASALTNRFGCRPVTMSGAVLACLGFVLSIFAPSIWFMYFSYGVLGGFGLGLIYLPAIVSVSFYFEKKRAFATGMAVSGAGIGAFIFAPFSQFLLATYSWKGAVLIEAGLLLNCMVFGALFRPLTLPKKKQQAHENGIELKQIQDTTSTNPGPSSGNTDAPNKITLSVQSLPHALNPRLTTEIKNTNNAKIFASDMLLYRTNQEESTLTRRKKDTTTRHISPLARKDIFYSRSLVNIPLYNSNPVLYTQSIASLPKQPENEPNSKCSFFRDIYRSIVQMLDLTLLKDPVFILFGVSNLLTSLGYFVPYSYLPDRAKQTGVTDRDAAFLISVIGISNTVGRVVFGWISDLSFVNRLMLYNMVLTLCGICTALSVAATNYVLLVLYSASYGVFMGVYVSLTSVVTVDLLGLEKLTNAFGLILFFQGIGAVVGPPIAGWLFDSTGNYNDSFYLMGSIIAVSGAMLFTIPCIRRCQHRKPENEQHAVDMGKIVDTIEIPPVTTEQR